jgi:hypothetical protein
MATCLGELDKVFECGARDYLALDRTLVRTYNKIKHGFCLIQRPDKLGTRVRLHKDWKHQVHILTGVTGAGGVKFTSIERTQPMMESLLAVIKMCAAGWKELTGLLATLEEKGISLDASPKTPNAPATPNDQRLTTNA